MEIVNSCEKQNGGCSHHCEHTTNGPLCSCNPGYRLQEDRQTCIGRSLSLSLSLSVSKSLSPPLPPCTVQTNRLSVVLLDHDECEHREACCSQVCKNSPGGYECNCRAGFRMQRDGCICAGTLHTHQYKPPVFVGVRKLLNHVLYVCVFCVCVCVSDIDECLSEKSPCEHNCVNTLGTKPLL